MVGQRADCSPAEVPWKDDSPFFSQIPRLYTPHPLGAATRRSRWCAQTFASTDQTETWIGREPDGQVSGNTRDAEGEGFEPPRPAKGLPVFKTGAFNQALPPLHVQRRCRMAVSIGPQAPEAAVSGRMGRNFGSPGSRLDVFDATSQCKKSRFSSSSFGSVHRTILYEVNQGP